MQMYADVFAHVAAAAADMMFNLFHFHLVKVTGQCVAQQHFSSNCVNHITYTLTHTHQSVLETEGKHHRGKGPHETQVLDSTASLEKYII